MGEIAGQLADCWDRPDTLDRALADAIARLPLCRLAYAVDPNGVQISANMMPAGADPDKRGQPLADRPYLANAVPASGLLLSEVYVNQGNGRPCLSAVHRVVRGAETLGFVVADFCLKDLPVVATPPADTPAWRQIRGDPAIRGTLFQQSRTVSAMDERIADVIAIMEELITERGVFHAKLHFSSSRATLWLLDDPYHYRLHVLDEIINPSVCLAYPQRPYPGMAGVPRALVRPVFERFRRLREADETLYLRAGSLNVINGMVGLNFSCDGSHYMLAQEFLEKDDAFWFGS